MSDKLDGTDPQRAFAQKLTDLCANAPDVSPWKMADLLERQAELLRDAEVERTR